MCRLLTVVIVRFMVTRAGGGHEGDSEIEEVCRGEGWGWVALAEAKVVADVCPAGSVGARMG